MSRETGRQAEDKAAEYLASLGYVILARNYAIRGAEVDIIAREGDFLVFVEVKYRKSTVFMMPRESVSQAKQRRVGQAALRWLQENALPDTNVRFDVVEITPREITLLRAAFDYIE